MGNAEKGGNYGELKTHNLYHLTECVKELHMIADDADDVLSLNVMCFDDHFSVKGKDTEMEREENVDVHYLKKGVIRVDGVIGK